MALVNGTKKKKSSFFVITKTSLKRGFLFLTGDRPNESTFRNLLESIPFFGNYEDRAKEDNNSSDLKDLQGLVVAANDTQITSRVEKSEFKTRAVQPSQVSETVQSSESTVGSVVGKYEGDTVTVAREEETTTHNKYAVSITSGFLTWLGSLFDQVQGFIPRLLPTGGAAKQYLVKKSGSDFDVEWADGGTALATLYVDLSNNVDGDGSVTSPFKSIPLVLAKIDNENLTNRTVEVAGGNYTVSSNIARAGIDWSYKDGVVLTAGNSGIAGDYLYDCSILIPPLFIRIWFKPNLSSFWSCSFPHRKVSLSVP